MSPVENLRLDAYEISSRLGAGGSALVYTAIERGTGRQVAIKVTPRGCSADGGAALEREAAILKRLNEARVPGVVRVHDRGLADGRPWYAMDLISNGSLRDRLQNGHSALESALDRDGSTTVMLPDTGSTAPPVSHQPAFSPTAVAGSGREAFLRALLELARSLNAVHCNGVVHGDLSPSNILFDSDDKPILIDFGTARLSSGEGPRRYGPVRDRRGTPAYVAPEIIRGSKIDTRADLYSLGCILYECVTGRRPFVGASAADIARQHLQRQPIPPSACAPAVTGGLEALILALLEKDPWQRMGRADDVIRALCAELGQDDEAQHSSVVPLFEPRLKGRDSELQRLRSFVLDRSSTPGPAVVVAASGMGKSALLRALWEALDGEQITRLWCACDERGPHEASEQRAAASLATLEPLIAHLQAKVLGTPSLIDDRVERAMTWLETFRGGSALARNAAELATAAAKALTALAMAATSDSTRPLVVLIDDLQRADDLSLAALTELDASMCPSLVVVASAELGASHAAFDALLASSALRLDLRALDESAMRQMLKDCLATDVLPESVMDEMQNLSDGSPLYLLEYVRAAAAQGHLAMNGRGGWFIVAHAPSLPATVQGLIDDRLGRLSSSARRLASRASVLGRAFELRWCGALGTLDVDLDSCAEELVACEIIEPIGPGRFRFAREALRHSAQRSLTDAERTALHRTAALTLEREPHPAELAAAIGQHWVGARDAARAVPHLEQAARSACKAYSYRLATDLLRVARGQYAHLQASGDDGATAGYQRVSEELADLLLQQAKHGEARGILNEILATVPRAERLLHARTQRKLAASFWTKHEYPEAAGALSAAAQALGSLDGGATEPEWTECVEIAIGHFERLYFSGATGPELERALAELGRATEQHGTAQQRCFYYLSAASHRLLQNRYRFDAAALEYARLGLAQSESRALDRRALGHFMLGFCNVFGTTAQCSEAVREFAIADELAGAVSDTTLLARIRIYCTIALLRLGQLDAAADQAGLALMIAEEAQLEPYVAAARACLGWVSWRRGAIGEASRLYERARSTWQRHPHPFPFSNLATFGLMEIALARDDPHQALALSAELPSGLPGLSDGLERARAALASLRPDEDPFAAYQALSRFMAQVRDAALI